MDPKHVVRQYLRLIRDVWPPEQAERLGLVYRGPADFVLQEGRWWKPRPLPEGVQRGAPRACYGNSIALATLYDLRYVQGFAVHFAQPELVVPHAWAADAAGNVVEGTWNPVGMAYLGVELTVERADDGTWNGDADPIDDFNRGWPLLRERWTGRDSIPPTWEPSPVLRVLRSRRVGDEDGVRRWLALDEAS